MSEKRLSEIMAASSRAIEDAQEVLYEAITDAINTFFDAGVAVERERIIKLLENYFKPAEAKALYQADHETYLDLIALIKGENK